MNIALTNFHMGWGGQPFQVLLLAKSLAAVGHTATVFAPPESDLAQRAKDEGADVCEACSFRRGFRPAALYSDIVAFRNEVKKRGIEVVHCHGSQDTWLAVACRFLTGADYALVRTKHNSYPVTPHYFNRRLYAETLERTIAVAEPIRTDILAASGASEKRVVAIHAGLPDDFGNGIVNDAPASVREEFGIPADSPIIGLTGRLAPDKGQEVLMKAFVLVREKYPAAHLLLVGTGGDYDRQLEIRKSLGLEESVHFTLFRDDIARLTAAYSVAVLAATACDASSTVVKEAMRLGVPVVGTNVGGTSDLLDDGRCGALVKPGDEEDLASAIASILDNAGSAEQAAMIERARQRVNERYVMSAVVRQTLDVYTSALEARK